MTIQMTSFGLPAALLAASLFAACQNTAQGIQKDTEINAEKAKAASEDAAAAAKRAGEQAKDVAERAAEATSNAASKASTQVAGATQTMEVKTALMADKTVDASGVDVDTNEATKTVTLKGHVPNAGQKAAAERIAKEKASGYTIVNMLVVGS